MSDRVLGQQTINDITGVGRIDVSKDGGQLIQGGVEGCCLFWRSGRGRWRERDRNLLWAALVELRDRRKDARNDSRSPTDG